MIPCRNVYKVSRPEKKCPKVKEAGPLDQVGGWKERIGDRTHARRKSSQWEHQSETFLFFLGWRMIWDVGCFSDKTAFWHQSTDLIGSLLFLPNHTQVSSITMNKASGGDGIPVELFQILKDDAVKVLHSICQQIWKAQQWPQDWKRSFFIPIPKKGNAKECSNYCTIALISHASKVMLKILQARLQQHVNHELPDVVQPAFRKGKGTWDQIANILWIIKKAWEFQKNINFCFIDYAKAFDFVDHIKLWKILKKIGIPDHLTCLLRNLCAGQEATVRTVQGTTEACKNLLK